MAKKKLLSIDMASFSLDTSSTYLMVIRNLLLPSQMPHFRKGTFSSKEIGKVILKKESCKG